MKSTNYHNTFIAVAADCPATSGQAPPSSGSQRSIARLQFELLDGHPYEYTSDDVLFAVYAARNALPAAALDAERARFFAKGQPCLRASPLTKRYGWGVHCDADGKIALVGMETAAYRRFRADDALVQKTALRSRRAR